MAGSVYTILAFIGFEAAAPLAEEARDPRRTIRQAVIYSCLGIGLFYVLTTYAATRTCSPSAASGSCRVPGARQPALAVPGRGRDPPYPISLVGPVVGTWYAIGLVYLVVLVRTRPERLRETGRVFVDEPAGEAPAPR